LQARGLVRVTPAGLAVAELTRPHVSELYAMRAVVEGAAARIAAENASAGDLVALRHAGELFSEPQQDPAQFARVNMMFHEAIYEAAHNSYLSRMVEDLNDSLALLPRTTFLVPGRLEAARIEHTAILEAIEERDPDLAEQAARTHIRHALEGRLKLIFTLRAANPDGLAVP
jgi:DNA-binding GntR family transcriptional regulator